MTETKPSKSERKRRQHALQELGEQLIALGDELLDSLKLDERLDEAIREARKMTSREALRRHKQYIGRLMRDVDTAPIEALFVRLKADRRRENRLFADAERWRDRLVRDGRSALAELQAETGEQLDDVGEMIDELAHAFSDRAEKTLRRNIFRRVHAALAAHRTDVRISE